MHRFAWLLPFFCVCMAAPQSVKVTARVFDQIGVPVQVVKRAEEEGSYLLQRAAFAMQWINCANQTDLCSNGLGPDEVVFLLRTRSARKQDKKPEEAGAALLSGPSHTGIYAMIYYDQILRTPTGRLVAKGDLLTWR